jgi:flagellar basal body P-ring formation protein FlgA
MNIRTLLYGTALAALTLGPALADPLRLRADVIVDGDTVRLGQLIEGLEKGADIPVFRAPAPGARGTIRADRVLAAAREMGVTGLELTGARSVTITRPGRTISRGDMQDSIRQAFALRGAKGDLDVILDDHHAARTVDVVRDEPLKVIALARDPSNGRFEVKMALANANTGESWILTGSIVETREVAVPIADLDRGDALQAKDLTIVKRPASHVGNDIVASMSDLVGMIPRRVLKAGEPVRQADLAKPILVEKNQLVTVTYSGKGISLSMRGRAQSNGAMGETIRVLNPQSKRMLEGTVSGQAQVTISAPPAPAATLADATATVRR